MSLVSAEHIFVQFGQKIILTDVHLSVGAGEIVTLIGPNGAGKSTLVRVVLGLLPPNRGSVQLQEGIRIGYMPQSLSIEPFMPLSVLRFLGLAPKISKARLEAVMQEVGIQHLQSAAIQFISGGERQRVLLARALLHQPQLLVLDEPMQGVDVMGQEELYRLIVQIRDRHHCGILMVSHDLHLVMAGTDSVICLNKHVCCSGHPAAVTKHPEFLSLFGDRVSVQLAVYAHEHDHRHDGEDKLCS